MKKALFIIGCVILSVVTLQSCKESNKNLHTDVERVLQTGYPAISSSVNDGVVTLTGTVDSEQERISAENAVRSVKHVKTVVNNITVHDYVAPAPVTVSRDAALRSTIMSRLHTEGYDNVNVEVVNGDVILSGNLDRSDLNGVMRIANEADPDKVTNNLNLR